MNTYTQLHDMILHVNTLIASSTRDRYIDSVSNISSVFFKFCETIEHTPTWSMKNARIEYTLPSKSEWLELKNINKLPNDIIETLVRECDINKGSTILSAPDPHLPQVYAIRITHPEHDHIDLLFCQDEDPEIEGCTWEVFPPQQRPKI